MKPVDGIELELALLGRAVMAGVILSIIYDMIRVIRRLIAHGTVWVALEDCIYWIASGSWLFLKVCQVNNGIIRGYMILGIVAGALIYHALPGRYAMRFLTKWIIVVKKRLKTVAKAVTIKIGKVHRR